MRDVLFRGKWTLLNEWLEGDLIQYSDTYQEIMDKKLGRQYPIDPSTCGQFSGLTDKNGKKVFEGDILKSIDGIFLVCWDEEKSAFVMRFLEYPFETLYLEEMWDDAEIIGNIHDNPELLEAKQ